MCAKRKKVEKNDIRLSLVVSGRLDLAHKPRTVWGFCLFSMLPQLPHDGGTLSVVSGIQSHLERDGGMSYLHARRGKEDLEKAVASRSHPLCRGTLVPPGHPCSWDRGRNVFPRADLEGRAQGSRRAAQPHCQAATAVGRESPDLKLASCSPPRQLHAPSARWALR